ncbi:Penicillin-binding Protein dimerisation domain-containing protein [Thermomonospora echinospora]|uniref:Penicillin-binding Protein dimerisation domain-containing protein n=1 Tax=Thermomonospora echinospora TaxID=1992 RepID=A0A1H6A1F9_9ACTN|nr:penicillin-binding transpeptidase domain-containing protein [Thermomonospora echinospora]SEG41885.1 Penicillin-binding Protein dimerisation domain-containing protein [Thermomonospora echinospora]
MRRSHAAVAVAAVAVLVGTSLWWFLRGDGGPQETARRYLDAWQRGDYAAMQALVDDPPADFAERHRRLRDDLGAARWMFTLASLGDAKDGVAGGAYEAKITLAGDRTWAYQAALPFVQRDGAWRVDWNTRVLHPDLKDGQRLRASRAWPDRAPILSAEGSSLLGHSSGSVQQLVGAVGKLTAEQAKQLGAPYREGDPAGTSGLQQQYEKRLAGTPALAVQIVDGEGGVVKTLQRFGGKEGAPLRTTIDPAVQQSAGEALADVDKPASLVAVRPATGEILAVANKPGGYNRALMGQYPPGSTFKIITAAALVADGVSPSSSVACPATTNVGGRSFRNSEHKDYGTVSFRDAFAHSCNTTFARMAVDRLGEERLAQVAHMFGFGAPIIGGLPAVRGAFPSTKDATALAAASFGQGQVLASPLNMASVAAAAADGTWRSPRLVPAADAPQALDAKGRKPERPRPLESGVTRALRSLMPAVVSEGTAAGVGFPSGTAGKTGTAEFGSGDKPPTHAWFVGYRKDVAFAVIVEGGGTGAEAAAPIAARFLRGL